MVTDKNIKLFSQQEQQLITDIKTIVAAARKYAYKSANIAQVASNWIIDKRIVEQEKQGQERADYGKRVVKMVSEELTKEFGTGYSVTNLKSFAKFYSVSTICLLGR